MIQLQPDQTLYRVAYPDGLTVDVPALTQGELALGGAATSEGLWLRVLEKAWGIRKIRTSTKDAPTDEPIDVMGHGGSAQAALEAMTGHRAKHYRLAGNAKGRAVDIAVLRAAVQDAIETHHLAVATTSSDVKVPGINSHHAYALLGYDASTDQVQIWNPHVNKFTPRGEAGIANGYPTFDGSFSLPLADFLAVFGGVSIETDATKPTPEIRQ